MSAPQGFNAILSLQSPWRTFLRTAITVTSTATALPTTALDDRKGLYLFNTSAVRVFLGNSSVGTTADVILFPNSGIFLPISDQITMYGIVSSGNRTVIVWEYK